MLDAIEVDVEHSERVNTSVLHCRTGRPGDPFRKVDVLWIRPSHLVRELAQELVHRMPAVVRYLLRGLGSDAAVTELASYLLFDTAFCGRLIDLGRQDVAAERERIARFFAASATLDAYGRDRGNAHRTGDRADDAVRRAHGSRRRRPAAALPVDRRVRRLQLPRASRA